MAIEVILVGGFLGAGKTTLLGRAARLAKKLGGDQSSVAPRRRVALVTNDQAANLVDTAMLEGSSATSAGGVREVAGGCFCCRFPDLLATLESLADELSPDTILCEPVGSCTDISATVIQPLKKLHAGRFRLAPYTVLIDPDRALEALGPPGPLPTFPDNVFYIFRKQVEEADLVVVNKIDATPPYVIDQVKEHLAKHCPQTPILTMSALTGEGIDEWLGQLRAGTVSGSRIAEVDYDQYADSEAALGWLNAKVELRARQPVNWHALVERLMVGFHQRLQAQSAQIAHVKLRLTAGHPAKESLAANLTSTAGVPAVRGKIDTSRKQAVLLFNARVGVDPDSLRRSFKASLDEAAGDAVERRIAEIDSFSPARPQPTYRFDSVMG